MGDGFRHDIAGGDGNLIAVSVQSPDFVHDVSGWQVRKDGSAEFNNVTVRGNVIIVGTHNGEFRYSGTPAAGNLVYSNSNLLGVTDPTGLNYVLPGEVTYFNTGLGEYIATQINENGIYAYTAPDYHSSYTPVSGVFYDYTLTIPVLMITGFSGVPVSIQNPSTATVTLDAGWNTNAGYLVPQYRLTPLGDIQFAGLVSQGSAFTGTVALNSGSPLAAAYRPSKIKAVCQSSQVGNRARVEYHSDGILYAVGTTAYATTTAEIENGAVSLL